MSADQPRSRPRAAAAALLAVGLSAAALALACSPAAHGASPAAAAAHGASPAAAAAHGANPALAQASALEAATPAPLPAGSTRVVVLDADHQVFAQPGGAARRGVRIAALRPITGARTVLPQLAEAVDRRGARWLRVLLPGRPNGHSGWIAARGTRAKQTPWRLRVDTGARTVTAFQHGRALRVFRAVVGAPASPTPHGRFFVEETIRLGPHRDGAPFALALSARSDVFSEFAGGPGQTALHGLGNVGGVLGSAVSHGCVRLDAWSIGWLAARIAPGTPVAIAR